MSKFDVKKLFYNNRFVAVLSLFLALVFWLLVNLLINPVTERVFNNVPVNIDTTGTAAGAVNLEVITQSVEMVSVTVKGERFAIHRLTENDIEAYASTINVNDKGVYNLPISARLAGDSGNTSVEFSVNPVTVTARFDQKETRDFTLQPVIENVTAAEGLSLGELSIIDNSSITIYGPVTELNTIDSVKAIYSPDTPQVLSNTIYPMAEIKLYDKEGAEISPELLEISPSNMCYITVPVMMNKTVDLRVRYSGAYSSLNLPSTLSRTQAEITGQVGVVTDISYLNLYDISLNEISPSNNVFQRNINFSRVGLSLTDRTIEPITVTFDMTGYSEKRFSVPKENQHVVTGLASGLSYELLTTNSVVMVGPSSLIESINANELYYEIDLSGITAPGTYERNVNVRMVNNNSVWAYGRYTCSINITQI